MTDHNRPKGFGESTFHRPELNTRLSFAGSTLPNPTKPVISYRKACIIDNKTDCDFKVEINDKADNSEPLVELSSQSTVASNSFLIEKAAKTKGVDANLIRAIMYIETTHGWYDAPLDYIGKNKSIRPMNINVDYWGDFFGNRSDMSDTEKNIMAGAEMLKRIIANMPPKPRVDMVATLYNNINATKVSNYGARVAKIYVGKLWQK